MLNSLSLATEGTLKAGLKRTLSRVTFGLLFTEADQSVEPKKLITGKLYNTIIVADITDGGKKIITGKISKSLIVGSVSS